MNAILTQQMNEIQRVRWNTQRLLQAIHICNYIVFILRISRRINTATTAIQASSTIRPLWKQLTMALE